MKKKWVEIRKGADFRRISEKYHISPVLARIIRNRDVVGDKAIEEYLYGDFSILGDSFLLKDMDVAIEILKENIGQRKRIRIIGDYDIDGVHATYILLQGLQKLGALVDTDIPDRMKDGYGLNIRLVERAGKDEVNTIITCDNGIAAAREVAFAKEQGMTVIVTDHHEVPYEEAGKERKEILPRADAVINPKRKDCSYPFKGLCGAAVAYKVIDGLYRALGKDVREIYPLIQQVAFATIGDVMDLQGENRTLVRLGLEGLRHTTHLGMRALMDLTGIVPEQLSAYHVGFVLGPCVNAGGRLDTAKRALKLLCAADEHEAEKLAGDLKALNDSRKEMTERAVKEAIYKVEEGGQGEQILVVFLPECHESLAGIVAGRIRERYYRPTIVLTKGKDGLKGSARSVPSYHMYEKLAECKDLLLKFGGHKLAAGMSLKEEHLDTFRTRLNQLAGLTEEDLTEKLELEMELPLRFVTEALVEELKLLEPCGKANPKPIFGVRGVYIRTLRRLGKEGKVLKFLLEDEQGTKREAISFFPDPEEIEELEKIYNFSEKGMFAFYPDVNEFRGQKTIQLIVKDFCRMKENVVE